jgi:hypothetical protein
MMIAICVVWWMGVMAAGFFCCLSQSRQIGQGHAGQQIFSSFYSIIARRWVNAMFHFNTERLKIDNIYNTSGTLDIENTSLEHYKLVFF